MTRQARPRPHAQPVCAMRKFTLTPSAGQSQQGQPSAHAANAPAPLTIALLLKGTRSGGCTHVVAPSTTALPQRSRRQCRAPPHWLTLAPLCVPICCLPRPLPARMSTAETPSPGRPSAASPAEGAAPYDPFNADPVPGVPPKARISCGEAQVGTLAAVDYDLEVVTIDWRVVHDQVARRHRRVNITAPLSQVRVQRPCVGGAIKAGFANARDYIDTSSSNEVTFHLSHDVDVPPPDEPIRLNDSVYACEIGTLEGCAVRTLLRGRTGPVIPGPGGNARFLFIRVEVGGGFDVYSRLRVMRGPNGPIPHNMEPVVNQAVYLAIKPARQASAARHTCPFEADIVRGIHSAALAVQPTPARHPRGQARVLSAPQHHFKQRHRMQAQRLRTQGCARAPGATATDGADAAAEGAAAATPLCASEPSASAAPAASAAAATRAAAPVTPANVAAAAAAAAAVVAASETPPTAAQVPTAAAVGAVASGAAPRVMTRHAAAAAASASRAATNSVGDRSDDGVSM